MKKLSIFIGIALLVGVGIYTGYKRLYPYKYKLSVTAIMKNEKPYLKEWLEYHILQGAEHFYLCDNESTDGSREYLQPYIENGLITYIPMIGKNQQLVCYDKVVKEYGNESQWMAFIDLDEFLVPLQADNMVDFLQEFTDANEVSLHWINYGDNGLFKRDGGLVIEAFTAHGAKLNHTVKSIVRPNAVIDFKSFGANHYVPVKGKSVNEYHKPVSYMLNFNISGDKARVNHYITKSFAEFINKKRRGHPEGTAIDYKYYFFHNENEVKNDSSMSRFLPQLKKRMEKSPLADINVPQSEELPETFADFYFTPEEASQILGREVTEPLSFYEVEQTYKENKYPTYIKK